jgi:hypothetical protein
MAENRSDYIVTLDISMEQGAWGVEQGSEGMRKETQILRD